MGEETCGELELDVELFSEAEVTVETVEVVDMELIFDGEASTVEVKKVDWLLVQPLKRTASKPTIVNAVIIFFMFI